MFKWLKKESRKVLLNTINVLEDENKELKSRIETAQHNNLILLENAEELRKEVKVKEDIIKSLLEDIEALKEESFKNAKKGKAKTSKK
jgi:septum formation inhibitor-activating ATPase MinD